MDVPLSSRGVPGIGVPPAIRKTGCVFFIRTQRIKNEAAIPTFTKKGKKMKSGKIEALALAAIKAAKACAKAIISLRKTSLSYRELIEDITKSKPDDPRVVQCAVLKQEVAGDIEISVVFLDKDNQFVMQSEDGKESYGFCYTLKSLDSELAELFANHDMVILK